MGMKFTDKMKTNAQSRMWVKWKQSINGYQDMIYYSFENKRSIEKNDIEFGLSKLVKLAKSSNMIGKYEIAVIYDNKTGTELMKFKDGIRIN